MAGRGTAAHKAAVVCRRVAGGIMLIKVANKDTEGVVTALIKQSQKLPGELYRSLTWDRGKELADHQRLKLATDLAIVSSWPARSRSTECHSFYRGRLPAVGGECSKAYSKPVAASYEGGVML
jgi:IS30 family transposase